MMNRPAMGGHDSGVRRSLCPWPPTFGMQMAMLEAAVVQGAGWRHVHAASADAVFKVELQTFSATALSFPIRAV
jgi:hypothetical protein